MYMRKHALLSLLSSTPPSSVRKGIPGWKFKKVKTQGGGGGGNGGGGGGPFIKYDDYVCRINRNDNGDKDKDYTKSFVSFNECKNVCRYDSDCSGIEYNDSNGACESWTTAITSVEYNYDHKCWVKVPEPGGGYSSFTAEEDPDEDVNGIVVIGGPEEEEELAEANGSAGSMSSGVVRKVGAITLLLSTAATVSAIAALAFA